MKSRRERAGARSSRELNLSVVPLPEERCGPEMLLQNGPLGGIFGPVLLLLLIQMRSYQQPKMVVCKVDGSYQKHNNGQQSKSSK